MTNRQTNATHQFSPGYSNKRKADNSNVNMNKKGRFQHNNNNNNNGSQNVNSQQFSATNQQIPQQSLMTDFSQDFYTAQWH
jgi:hypothetical protein